MTIGKSWNCPHCNRPVIIRDDDKVITCQNYSLQVNPKDCRLCITTTTCPSESCGKETIELSKYLYNKNQNAFNLIYNKMFGCAVVSCH
jgi:hypothetical protein